MQADYICHMGDDLLIVNAARVSFAKHHAVFDSAADTRLIRYLARHGHWTPFAHPQITVRETVPVFVARQRFKHTVGFVYNEVSRRYVDDAPEFFSPPLDGWRRKPDGDAKQGSAGEIPRVEGDYWHARVSRAQEHAEEIYAEMIEGGIAPEQARMILPQSMLTSYYVTGSLAAWARAFKQRIDPHAQKEIRALAGLWGRIIAPLYPVAWSALTEVQ